MRGIAKGPVLFVLGAVILTAGVLAYSMFANKPVEFKDMPGIFKCEGFGLPDASFPRLWITSEMILKGVADGKEFFVGRLAPRDQGLELEYSMETVHFSTFNLDPFTAPRIAVYKDKLALRAKKGSEEFTAVCYRIPQ